MRAQHSVSPGGWLVLFVACLAVAGGAFTTVLAEPGADLPLVEAVKSRDTDAVRTLLAEGVDVNAPQSDGATALHWAAYRDDVDTAALLIEAGANVNTANELGATPLWLAADNGSPTMIERLLDAGANPNVALPEGETPVMTASRTGNADAVRLLLAHGAAINVSEHSRGQTALMWAVAQGHHAVVATLLEHSADVAARSKARPRLMHADSTNASQYDQGVMWNRGGFTPLLFAARHGDIDSARLLLRAGAEVNDTAPTGASALVVAAHSGHGAFAATLLDEGADPNAAGAGYTALHSAILRGDRTLVEQLLKHGADPNARLEKGTPIRRASQDWALNPSLVSATPFWLAAYYRDPSIMRALVAAGADPRLTTLELWRPVAERAGGVGPPHIAGGFTTPLMAAVRGTSNRGRFFNTSLRDPDAEERNALESVELSVELGADVNAADENGDTVLHSAASRNFTTIVRFLAAQGADLDVKNEAERTPLALAVRAEATRARRVDPTRFPSGNTAEVLREIGATEEETDDEAEDERR